MNIGIIVFSRTGNTLSVAEKIRDACAASGHTAIIEQVTAEKEAPGSKLATKIKSAPDPTGFDAVIFGAAVEGFSLSLIMKEYLSKIPKIQGKKAGCFVTQHFSNPIFGGNRSVKQMRALCSSKGGKVSETGVVNWGSKVRENQIEALALKMSKI